MLFGTLGASFLEIYYQGNKLQQLLPETKKEKEL